MVTTPKHKANDPDPEQSCAPLRTCRHFHVPWCPCDHVSTLGVPEVALLLKVAVARAMHVPEVV